MVPCEIDDVCSGAPETEQRHSSVFCTSAGISLTNDSRCRAGTRKSKRHCLRLKTLSPTTQSLLRDLGSVFKMLSFQLTAIRKLSNGLRIDRTNNSTSS